MIKKVGVLDNAQIKQLLWNTKTLLSMLAIEEKSWMVFTRLFKLFLKIKKIANYRQLLTELLAINFKMQYEHYTFLPFLLFSSKFLSYKCKQDKCFHQDIKLFYSIDKVATTNIGWLTTTGTLPLQHNGAK